MGAAAAPPEMAANPPPLPMKTKIGEQGKSLVHGRWCVAVSRKSAIFPGSPGLITLGHAMPEGEGPRGCHSYASLRGCWKVGPQRSRGGHLFV